MPATAVIPDATATGSSAPEMEAIELPNGAVQLTGRTEAEALADKSTEATLPANGVLPEKFKTVEELANAYKELEAKLGTAKPEGAKPDSLKLSKVEAPATIESVGIDTAKLGAEIASTGALSAESLKTLTDKGITETIIKAYVDGQLAIQERIANTLFETVGGAEKYNEMAQWAGANLTEPEMNAFNKALDSGDVETAKLLIQGVNAKFIAANGSDPQLITGDAAANAGVKPFSTTKEMTDAINDPRYKTDKAYNAQVVARIEISQFFGS